MGHEYLRHLTGSGQFTDDLKFGELAYGHVLRSPHAHAELGEIDTTAAKEQPGVVAVFTGSDLQRVGIGSIPGLYTLEQVDGSPMATPPNRPLALDRVRHVGDAVAFVVGESPAVVADAAERIEVEYSPLPSVTNANVAALPKAPLVWSEAPAPPLVSLKIATSQQDARNGAFL